MRKYRSNASSSIRIEYGVELCEGLAHFPETASFAVEMKKATEVLATQHQSRTALRVPILHARVKERLAHYQIDQAIRSSARAAEIADGGKRGRIFGVAFPKGLRPVVLPRGKNQVKAAEDLIDRIEKSQVPAIDTYRAEWLPKLKQALTTYTTAIANHTAAKNAEKQAFKQEVALREAHLDAVDKTIGLVRAAFPRDKEAQDAIFPVPNQDELSEQEEAATPA